MLMALQFIDKIRQIRYDSITDMLEASGAHLKQGCKMSHQQVSRAIREPCARKLDFSVLCAIRKACGVTWAKMGEMIDEEFGRG